MTWVVGYDGGDGGRAALTLARQFAAERERIVAVCVLEAPGAMEPGDLPSGVISAVVRDVGVADALMEIAEQEQATLIAIGSPARGHQGLLSSSLLRATARPLLVVPAEYHRAARTAARSRARGLRAGDLDTRGAVLSTSRATPGHCLSPALNRGGPR